MPGFRYQVDKLGNKIITREGANKGNSKMMKQDKNVVLNGPTTDGAFGQYMLGQLTSLAKYAKVDEPFGGASKKKEKKAEGD